MNWLFKSEQISEVTIDLESGWEGWYSVIGILGLNCFVALMPTAADNPMTVSAQS